MTQPATAALAASIAQDPRLDVLKNVTSSWLTILEELLLAFAKLAPICIPLLFSKEHVSEKEFVEAHFDATDGTFDHEILGRARPQVRESIKAAGIQPLGRKSCDAISSATFDGIRKAEDQLIAQVMTESYLEPAADQVDVGNHPQE